MTPIRTWMLLFVVAFGLNAGWELAQAPLYHDDHELAAWVYLYASTVDAVLISAVAAGALAARGRWPRAFWPLMTGVLLLIAASIELRAIYTGRWSYAATMPTLGPVGLSPLLQLPLLGALSVALVKPSLGPTREGPHARR